MILKCCLINPYNSSGNFYYFTLYNTRLFRQLHGNFDFDVQWVNLTLDYFIFRYVGYREMRAGEPYTKRHWQVMFGRFAFIFVFQFTMSFLKRFLAWAIPDVPKNLLLKTKREKHIAKRILNDPGLSDSTEQVPAKTYI